MREMPSSKIISIFKFSLNIFCFVLFDEVLNAKQNYFREGKLLSLFIFSVVVKMPVLDIQINQVNNLDGLEVKLEK